MENGSCRMALLIVLIGIAPAVAQPPRFPPRPPAYDFDAPPPPPATVPPAPGPYEAAPPQPFPSPPAAAPLGPPAYAPPGYGLRPRLGPVPPGHGFTGFERPLPIPQVSLMYIDPIPAHEIHVHDLITIIVKEVSESSVDSRFNRSRRGSLLAELREFVRFSEQGNLTNAAENEPTIDSNLNARLDATGRVTESAQVVYRIAATVVDVLPNGNLVLEARKTIESNGDIWEHTLTGTIRSLDVNRDNTALSENIANLRISKRQTGRVADSTRRPWGVRLLDALFPF